MTLDRLLDSGRLPDAVIRQGIRHVLRRRLSKERAPTEAARQAKLQAWIAELRRSPITFATDEANAQHYAVPPAFFEVVLGRTLKYSAGWWSGDADLDAADEAMLALTAERALIGGGQRILDLGCGWGSFCLYAARRWPTSTVVALSNSAAQRAFIEARAAARGLTNLTVVTADVAHLPELPPFDRIVSVEMFEHVRNYEALLAQLARRLRPDGRLFVHHFAHARYAYPYQDGGRTDWMARHFFTGGQMPSADLLLYFQRDLTVEEGWRVDGTHYAKTCEAWLDRLDARREAATRTLAGAPRPEAAVERWRIFFMACAELFAFEGGREWFVCHWRFKKR